MLSCIVLFYNCRYRERKYERWKMSQFLVYEGWILVPCLSLNTSGLHLICKLCLEILNILNFQVPASPWSTTLLWSTEIHISLLFLWNLAFLPFLDYAGRDWEQEEKGTTEYEMAGWHHWLDGHEFEWTPGVGDGQGGLACCNSWGHKELDTTERLNWTELTFTMITLFLPFYAETL